MRLCSYFQIKHTLNALKTLCRRYMHSLLLWPDSNLHLPSQFHWAQHSIHCGARAGWKTPFFLDTLITHHIDGIARIVNQRHPTRQMTPPNTKLSRATVVFPYIRNLSESGPRPLSNPDIEGSSRVDRGMAHSISTSANEQRRQSSPPPPLFTMNWSTDFLKVPCSLFVHVSNCCTLPVYAYI